MSDLEINTENTEKNKKKLGRKEYWIKELRAIIIIVVAVFAFRSTFYEPFRIPTGSMISTLMIGDFILVNKFAYGFRIPFSDTWGGNSIYFAGESEPKKGDVIVFKYPKDTSLFYIKRVVATPGDTFELIDKVIYINGVPNERIEIDGTEIMNDMDDKFSLLNFKFYKEKIGDAEATVQEIDMPTRYSYHEKITIPKGHFFVMGDNRDFSEDSRSWGLVPSKYLKGKAIRIWLSMILPFGDDAFKFRYWRIGKAIR